MYQATQAIGRWIVVKTTTIDDSQVNTGGAEESVPTPQKGGSWSMAQSGHTRIDSGESEDPLAWSPGTYQQRTTYIAGLVEDMSNTHIEDPGSASTSAVKGNDRADASGIGDWYWSAEYKCKARAKTMRLQAAGSTIIVLQIQLPVTLCSYIPYAVR
jgi:hypothetical protein